MATNTDVSKTLLKNRHRERMVTRYEYEGPATQVMIQVGKDLQEDADHCHQCGPLPASVESVEVNGSRLKVITYKSYYCGD